MDMKNIGKETYEKPIAEVIRLEEDTIVTSEAENSCYPCDRTYYSEGETCISHIGCQYNATLTPPPPPTPTPPPSAM